MPVARPDGLAIPKPKTTSPRKPAPRKSRPVPRYNPPSAYSPPASPPSNVSGPVPSVVPSTGHSHTPKEKKVKIPGIGEYLAGDAVYQQAIRGGERTLADFLSELGRRRGEAKANYKQSKQALERDRVSQLDKMMQEFASRGLIHSGLYAEEQGRFQQDFTTQLEQLQQARAQLLADILSQKTNYKREHELALEAAKQEALLRRAQKYNIPL